MSPGFFQEFMVFIPGVTQGQGKISFRCFGVNLES